MPLPAPIASARVRAATLIFLACLCTYGFTLGPGRPGYEAETIEQARSVLRGEAPVGRAGLLDVAFYLPFAAVSEAFASRDLLPAFRETIVQFAMPLEVALCAALFLLVAWEVASPGAAIRGALVFAFATIAWPYSKMGMEPTLLLATCLALLGFVRALRADRAAGAWEIMASGVGAMLLAKVHAPVVAACLGGACAVAIRRGHMPPPSAKAVARGSAILAACVVAWIGGNLWRYGRPFLSTSYSAAWEAAPPGVGGFFEHLAGYLVSPGKSVFLYSPPLFAALLVACSGPVRRERPWTGILLLCFVLPQVLFHAWFRTWADETWGPRRLTNLLPAMLLPLVFALEPRANGEGARASRTWRARRPLVAATILAGVAMQFVAVGMNYAAHVWTLREQGLSTQRNLAWTPATAHWRFQLALGIACARASAGLEPGPLRIPVSARSLDPEDYLPWNLPDEATFARLRAEDATRDAPEGISLDLSPFARHPDFWWAERWSRFPDRSPWRDRAFHLALLMALAGGPAVAGALRIAREADREQSARTAAAE